MEVKFYRNPGFFYDLYNILVMKLNHRAKWLDRVANDGHEKQDVEYIDACLEQFEDPNPELSIFFWIKTRKTKNYFLDIYIDILSKKQENMDLSDFFAYLDDTEKVKEEICAFYLGDKVDPKSLREVSDTLYQKKDIREEMRFNLLHFFADPTYFTEMLKVYFTSCVERLEELYAEAENKLEQCQKSFQYSELKKGLESIIGKTLNDQFDLIKTSNTVVSKNIVLNNDEWYILGYDYSSTLNKEFDVQVDIEKFGNAMGDQNRIQMIECILREGELSSGDLAKRLGIALNTATYHLDIMENAHLLCCRTHGKSTYYWLNIRACEKAIAALNVWMRKGGGKRR